MSPPNKPDISLLLLTKNESENIKTNFKWLKKCKRIREVIVIDDNSTDDTIDTCRRLASKNRKVFIFTKDLNTDFAAQRNYGISKTNYNWVLWLDADEKPSKKLIAFLNHFDTHQYKNYSFKRLDIFLKHTLRHGENAHLDFVRLFNKNYGYFDGRIHETWKTNKLVRNTKYFIFHYSHSTVRSLIQKINYYSDIRSRELFEKKVNTSIFQIIFYPIAKFIQNYFIRLGFLDGTPGIIMALSMSFHVFLNKSKLWHLYQQQS